MCVCVCFKLLACVQSLYTLLIIYVLTRNTQYFRRVPVAHRTKIKKGTCEIFQKTHQEGIGYRFLLNNQ